MYPPPKRIAELTKQNPNRIDQAPSPIESRNSSQIVNPENVNKRGEVSYLCKFTTSHVPAASQITFSSSVLGTGDVHVTNLPPLLNHLCACVLSFGGEVLNM